MASGTIHHANRVIEVSHVYTRFWDAVVHEDINLTIVPGEIFAIAGGNGSGKSTLLREIIGLHPQTEGTMRLFGQDVAGLGEQGAQNVYRRLGVMFQQGALFSSLTLAENVAVPLKEHTDISSELIRDIVAVKIATVELPMDSADKFPSELSGGMRRRAE